MKVALVHDWLVSTRGGERVLEAIAELYPDAEIFTLFHERGSVPASLERHRIHTSLLDRLPLARRRHRHFLPLMPAAVERLGLDGFDLIISSSHCVAKGVRKPSGARHLSYVHAPMRYMWHRFDDYFGQGRASLPVRAAALALRPYLQSWDRRSAAGVDRFVANSRHVARQIAELYGREASVVHPPVDLDRFAAGPLAGLGSGGYFLWLGALAPYKRVDLAIDAFARLRWPLVIVGSGQDGWRMESLPPNVRWAGQASDADLPALYRRARALIFTGEEDFGITPLEAMASGRPVVALARGGALETVSAPTGLFFDEPTPESLCEAMERFEAFEQAFRPEAAREQALMFSKKRFQEAFSREVEALG